MQTEDIALDLQELNRVLETLTRKENIKLINSRISSLKAQLQTLSNPKPQTPTLPKTTSSSLSPPAPGNTITVTKYSYDQQGKKVKIYLTFQNASTQLTPESLFPKFSQNSFQLLIKNYKNSNYLFAIKKLFAPIDVQASKCTIKSNNILITLVKKDGKNWDGLAWKENKFADKPEEKSGDPQAGIMNLMKKMYDEGDDNMKRTIAESWTKSREGKKE